MKKLFALILGILILTCSLFAFGCGNPVFNGNYENATKKEVEDLRDQLLSQNFTQPIDYRDGISISAEAYDKDGVAEEKVSVGLKTISQNGVLMMQAFMEMNFDKESVKLNYFHDGEYEYLDTVTKGVSVKYKSISPYEEVLEELKIGETVNQLFAELKQIFKNDKPNDNVNIKIDKKDQKYLKIKVNGVEDNNSYKASVDMCVVFDKYYNFIGAQTQTYQEDKLDKQISKLKLVIEPWSGKLNAPNASEYADFPFES